MYFLFNPLKFLSDIPGNVLGAMEQALRTLAFSLDTLIYGLIINLYNLFKSLCTARLLDNSILQELSKRVGLILGIVMLFNIIFSFIQMLLDPDKLTDNEKGAVSIVKKVIIVIVMLGVSNFVFDTLYQVQKTIINSNIISKLILPYSVDAGTDPNGVDKFGAIMSEELFYSFYQLENIDESVVLDDETKDKIDACSNAAAMFRNQIINDHRFHLGYNCLNETITVDMGNDSQEIFLINFNTLFSLVCGAVVVYLLFMYCLKVGVRMVQLMFLEIISPMAIVSYLSPKKDTAFSKWQKIYISTYIDVFIRMAIINFVFFLIATVFSTQAEEGMVFWESVGNPASVSIRSFYTVVIVLALLTFAHKAPDLLKELIGTSASKLGFGASMKDIVGLQKSIGTVAGAATGAAVGLLGGGVFGALGGVLRGGRAGFGAKGVGASFGAARKAQAEHNLAVRQGQLPEFMDRFSTAVGGETTKEMYDTQIADIEEQIDAEKVRTAQVRAQSSVLSNAGYRKKMEERAENKLLNDHFDVGDVRRSMQEQLLRQQAAIKVAERSGDSDAIASAQMEYNETLDRMKQDYIRYALSNEGDVNHFNDAGMNDIYANLANDLNNDTSGAFAGMNYNTETRQWINEDGVVSSGYAAIKALDDAITNRNSELSRQISVSDTRIKRQENRIQDIKNTQGYRDSHKIK